MTTRIFLSETELDALMDTLSAFDLPVAALDQLEAATQEAALIGNAMASSAVAAGGWAFLGTPGTDTARLRRMVRPRLRMMLAAFSAGAERLCPHTDQIRPQLLVCDPPTISCMDQACMDAAARARVRLGFRWDNECDACGRRVEMLTPHLMAMGPLSISGHLCSPCSRDAATTAFDAADSIQSVGRKVPCPCGSGRRFKRCHGNQRAAA